ncbi:hypothetical protein E4U42_001699 [Claviceps africana]|uniref:Pre-mRNA-splicing factor 38B n=1 Tax=Claviceps africana TaxID=83212 RepID=A0A8K0J8X6_9HYPO|nr:hypothetical protein E4U42_001699 [Claviceps africana]
MSRHELLTDDYVAGLLAQDAKDCSLKYSAMGMEAFRDNKKPASGPKPNTRFLRHIIRDTDAHNKALLAKETAESKARLSHLEHAEEARRRKSHPDVRDIRRRQMGDIHAILGGKKHPREDGGRGARQKTRDKDKDRQDSSASPIGADLFRDRDDSRQHQFRLSERERDRDRKHTASGQHRREKERPRGHRYAEFSEDDDNKETRRRSRRHRSRSPRNEHDGRDERRRRHRHRSRDRSRTRRSSPKHDAKPATLQREDDSDPLEDFIGPPPPPPNHRGRGTIGGAAALDRRFSESYDPKLDVGMDDGDDDPWDEAVESYRDRQKMRLNQDQRMKEAGFTAEQIQRAKGPEKKAEPHVVWSKAGEKREWDKGKGLSAEDGGHHDVGQVPSVMQSTLFSEDL